MTGPAEAAPAGVGDGLPDDAVEAAIVAIRDSPLGAITVSEYRPLAVTVLAAALPPIRRHIADELRAVAERYYTDFGGNNATTDVYRSAAARVARGGDTDDTKETK